MAVCVEVGLSNELLVSATPVGSCTSYVLLDASHYQDLPTLTDLFVVPLAADLQTMWMAGFSIPVICYLVAWGYQTVINFVQKG